MKLSNNKIKKDAQTILGQSGGKSQNSNTLTHKRRKDRDTIYTYDLMVILAICFFCIVIYSNTLHSPFVFDDRVNIHDNPKIRLTKLTLDGIISAGFDSYASHRPLANVSFALNYYLHRYDVAGYHLVNILMHIITGIILFYFVKVTLVLSNFQNMKIEPEKNTSINKQNCSITNSTNSSISTSPRSFSPTSTELLFIAFFITFIWLVHPIQTQTVSYVVQRMTSMAAMFYILSLLFYIKARLANTKRKKQVLFLGCILSGILSLGSKEIAVTLPFFIFLYEWFFFQEISLNWLKRNSIYFLCIFLFIILLAFFFIGSNPIKIILSTYNTRDFTLWQRVLTEFRVVIYYISLLIFPHPMRLNLLHDFTISHSFIDPITTFLSFITISGLMVTAIWLAKKERLLSFCILWFLGNLVIESSVLGLEIIFEHRVYLPSMFFILMLVSLVYRFSNSKWIWGVLLCVVAIVFSVWTYQRNIVWSDDVILWEDCVKKSPQIARPHYNLGLALFNQGRTAEAVEHYLEALRIKPDLEAAHNNLGNALLKQGRTAEAIEHYLKALRIKPDFERAHNNLGNALLKQGRTAEAIEHYLEALRIKPDFVDAHYNLGNTLLKQGRTAEAIEHYLEALRIKPDFEKAHNNLGNVLFNQGRTAEAIEHYLKALRIKPDFEKAHNNLGFALARTGDIEGAIASFRESIRINPNNVHAKKNLKWALMMQQKKAMTKPPSKSIQ